MRRALALLAAVALVAAAVAIRSAIDSGSTGDGDKPSGTTTALTVLCSSDLADACGRLNAANPRLIVKSEPPGTTVDRLAVDGSRLDADVWIVPEPWPGILAARRANATLPAALAGDRPTVGGASLNIALKSAQLPALLKACRAAAPSDVTWKCLADHAGRPLADGDSAKFTISIPPADRTAGLFSAFAIASGELGRSTFSTNDLEDAYDALFATLAAVSDARGTKPGDPSPIATLLNLPASQAATGMGGYASSLVGDPLRGVTAFTPSPAISTNVIVVVPTGRSGTDAVETIGRRALSEALRATGWGTPRPGGSGIAEPAVIDAVGTLWKGISK